MTILRAAAMMLEPLECGCFRLSMMDSEGRVFAEAEFGKEAGLMIASQIVDSTDEDEIGEVVGNA